MFATSSQRSCWTFRNVDDIEKLRRDANRCYIAEHGVELPEAKRADFYLSPEEERIICRHFEFVLQEFCKTFNPPLPRYVTSTALAYFKRFYLCNSVMDLVPLDMMLVCVYVACKVEEFYSPINQFVLNLRKNREKFASTILGFELLLVSKLRYQLTVHSPYRAFEGLLIHLKTKYKNIQAENLRATAEKFLECSLSTDVCLLFAPSQIALAALMASASEKGINLESYVADVLLEDYGDDVTKTLQQVKRIQKLVIPVPLPPQEQRQSILRKLEKCRNPENNPDSEVYKRKMEEVPLDEDDIPAAEPKRRKEDMPKD